MRCLRGGYIPKITECLAFAMERTSKITQNPVWMSQSRLEPIHTMSLRKCTVQAEHLVIGNCWNGTACIKAKCCEETVQCVVMWIGRVSLINDDIHIGQHCIECCLCSLLIIKI